MVSVVFVCLFLILGIGSRYVSGVWGRGRGGYRFIWGGEKRKNFFVFFVVSIGLCVDKITGV